MGVCATHYVVAGVKLHYKEAFPNSDSDSDSERFDEYFDNAYSDEIINKNDISIIADGMNGDYVVVGKIIAKAVAEHGDGLPMTCCDMSDDEKNKIISLIIVLFRDKFPHLQLLLPYLVCRVYAFTHYH